MKPWPYVGAKVVCVDATCDADCAWPPSERIREGATYAVVSVGTNPDTGRLGVKLSEVTRTNPFGYQWYHADRFRPVSTIDTTHQVNLLKKLVEKKTVEA